MWEVSTTGIYIYSAREATWRQRNRGVQKSDYQTKDRMQQRVYYKSGMQMHGTVREGVAWQS